MSLLIGLRVGHGRALAPILALAQMPLTFYLVHLWYSDTLWWDISSLLTTTAAFVAATLLFYAVFAAGAWLWLRVFRHGPIESLIDLPARAIIRPKPLANRPKVSSGTCR